MTELMDYPKYGLPYKRGGRYYYSYNSGLQQHYVTYTQKTLDAPTSILLDPNQWSEDGAFSAFVLRVILLYWVILLSKIRPKDAGCAHQRTSRSQPVGRRRCVFGFCFACYLIVVSYVLKYIQVALGAPTSELLDSNQWSEDGAS